MRNKSNPKGRVAFILAAVGVTTVSTFAAVVPASAKAVPKLVYAWGYNAVGELGQGTSGQTSGPGDSAVPVAVHNLVGVKAVAAGVEDGYALLKNGTVMAWGLDINGALGDGTFHSFAPYGPMQVTLPGGAPLTGVKAISAGLDYSLALMKNGTVMAWGYADDGELGVGVETPQGPGPDLCYDAVQTCSVYPVLVHGLSNVKAISAGVLDAYAVLKNGTVMTWGSTATTTANYVPVPVNGLSKVKAISAGLSTALALLKNGTVMTLDTVGNGPPVKVSGLSRVKAVSDGATGNGVGSGLALLKNGTVMSWDVNDSGFSDLPIKVSGLPGVKAISNGGSLALALLKDGTVRAWGTNAYGALGTGSDTAPLSSSVPVTVSGLSHIKAIGTSNDYPALPFSVASR